MRLRQIPTIFALIVLALLVAVPVVHAVGFPYFGGKDFLPCAAGSPNHPPCTSWCNILQLVQNLTYLALTLIIIILTPIRAVWGGIKIMVSGGNPKLLEAGKKTVTTALLWALYAFLAWAFVSELLTIFAAKIDPTGQEGLAWPEISCKPASISAGDYSSGSGSGTGTGTGSGNSGGIKCTGPLAGGGTLTVTCSAGQTCSPGDGITGPQCN